MNYTYTVSSTIAGFLEYPVYASTAVLVMYLGLLCYNKFCQAEKRVTFPRYFKVIPVVWLSSLALFGTVKIFESSDSSPSKANTQAIASDYDVSHIDVFQPMHDAGYEGKQTPVRLITNSDHREHACFIRLVSQKVEEKHGWIPKETTTVTNSLTCTDLSALPTRHA